MREKTISLVDCTSVGGLSTAPNSVYISLLWATPMRAGGQRVRLSDDVMCVRVCACVSGKSFTRACSPLRALLSHDVGSHSKLSSSNHRPCDEG